MAHFAEIDSNNRVLRVVVAAQDEIDAYGGDQSEVAPTRFQKTVGLSELGVKWVQTSKTGAFRKAYAAIGDIFDAAKNKFLKPQPYASWTLDGNDDWQAPTPKPVTYTQVYASEDNSYSDRYTWNEGTQAWDIIDDGV